MVPTHVEGIVTLLIFTLGLFVQGRQQEWTNRLDFLWKIQVTLSLHQLTLQPSRLLREGVETALTIYFFFLITV